MSPKSMAPFQDGLYVIKDGKNVSYVTLFFICDPGKPRCLEEILL